MLSTQLTTIDVELFRIVVRIDLRGAVRDDVEIRGGLRQRHARLQPRLEHEESLVDLRIGAGQRHGPP